MSDSMKDFDLLDMNLEDIADIPGFEVPWPGDYTLRMSAEIKTLKDVKYLELGYTVVSCDKKNDDASPDTPVGNKFSQLFALTGEEERVKQSLGFCKLLLKNVAEQVGEGNLLLLVRDHLPGMVCSATVNRRKDKDDPEKFYPVVKNLRKA